MKNLLWIKTICTLSDAYVMHRPIVDFFNSNRVFMTGCEFTSNFSTKIIFLGPGGYTNADYTRNQIEDCLFQNFGLNYEIQNNGSCACDPSLGSISNTNFYGSSYLHYTYPNPYPPTTCLSPWNYTFAVDNGLCGLFPETDYLGQVTGTIDPLNVLLAQTVLFGKFKNLVDPNSAMPLYSNPCSAEMIDYPTECSSYERSGQRKTHSENQIRQNLYVSPNPVNDIVTIYNLSPDGFFEISDLVGNIILRGDVQQENILLNISQFQPGIYFLRSPNSSTVKFIKM